MTGKGKNCETLFEIGRSMVAGKQRWTSGETVVIHKSPTFAVSISEGGYDGGGLLALTGTIGTWPHQNHVTYTCGMLLLSSPERPWSWTLDRREYDEWVRKCRAAIYRRKGGR